MQTSRKPSRAPPIRSLDPDILRAIFAFLDHFGLVRCSLVCKSWHRFIFTSTLFRDLYLRNSGNNELAPCQESSTMFLKCIALKVHQDALLSGSPIIHRWNCHSSRFNLCRMKKGEILTGGGDKVLRIWSAERYSSLEVYTCPSSSCLVDCDFDESKIVGLSGSEICIWRRSGGRNIFGLSDNTTKGLCMSYIDPEIVVGCEDGRARVFDMYTERCTRIIRMRSEPVSCIALTDSHLVLGGSTFGVLTIADLLSGEKLACLKSSLSPLGMKTLCFNMSSSLVFAGSSPGYAHCWDLRTLMPIWEMRISPNAIYSISRLPDDSSFLVAGGLDGVVRILHQATGEVLSSYVEMAKESSSVSESSNSSTFDSSTARSLEIGMPVHSLPTNLRPPIASLAVGVRKIVTAHNDTYLRVWKFNKKDK